MSVFCLFPKSMPPCALSGLYLDLQLHRQAAAGEVLIYSNYIASLDGRIALRDAQTGEFTVPDSIANSRDWRLYQELAAQADVMLTSARYFRQLEQGCAQDLLPVGRSPNFKDLAIWRAEQGLKPQPDVMILSASLDLPLSVIASLKDRTVMVLSVENSDRSRRQSLIDAGVQVYMIGEQQVDGVLLQKLLIQLAYKSAYMIAGPAVHHTLLSAGVLNRLFLTTHLSLLGADSFHSILQGEMLPVQAHLNALYLDQYATGSQMFADYSLREALINS